LIQGEQHTDPAIPPALGISSGNVAEKVVETPQNASNDLNARVQGQLFALAPCQCSYYNSCAHHFEAENPTFQTLHIYGLSCMYNTAFPDMYQAYLTC
jgi:hypothetical protein